MWGVVYGITKGRSKESGRTAAIVQVESSLRVLALISRFSTSNSIYYLLSDEGLNPSNIYSLSEY